MNEQMVFERYELKYRLSRRQQQALVRAMAPYMALDGYGHSVIRNLYYDTPDMRLIRRSLEKPVYKEKLRVRSYGCAGMETPVFVELKKKYEDVVYKRRILLPQGQALACLAGDAPLPDSQIGREIAYALSFYGTLRPAVFLSYARDAYAPRDGGPFRVTLDTQIRYRTDGLTLGGDCGGRALLAQDQVLMELKTPDAIPLWMARALSACGVRRTSFSKYGAAYRQMCREGQKEACSHVGCSLWRRV